MNTSANEPAVKSEWDYDRQTYHTVRRQRSQAWLPLFAEATQLQREQVINLYRLCCRHVDATGETKGPFAMTLLCCYYYMAGIDPADRGEV